jgi:hypothetical protein
MAHTRPFFARQEVLKEPAQRVLHDNDVCTEGCSVRGKRDAVDGTAGYLRCLECTYLKRHGR